MASPIQVKTATSIGTANLSVTLTSTGSGHSLVIYVLSFAFGSTNNTVSSIALGATGDTISKAVGFNGTTNSPNFEIWTDLTASSGQTTVTITFTAGNAGNLNIAQVEEWPKLQAVDKTNNNSNSGQTTFSAGGTGTLSSASELVIGAVAGKSSTSSFTFTGPSSPWTNETQVSFNSGSENIAMLSGYNTVSATTSVDYTGSISPGENYSALIVSYTFPGVTVNLPVAQVQKRAFTVGPSLYVNLPVAAVQKTAPLTTPGIVILVHLPAASVKKSAFGMTPAKPAILLLSIATRPGTDPYGLTPYPAGYTSFSGQTAGPANNTYTNLNTGSLNYITNGITSQPGTLFTANVTGTMFLDSGTTGAGGDDSAGVLLSSADQTFVNSTGLSFINLDANAVQLQRGSLLPIPQTAPSVSGADGIAIVNALKNLGIFK